MLHNILPLLALPNDTNESDISLVLANGEIITASEAMKKYPLIKELLQRNIKIMADKPGATISNPQIWPVSYNSRNFGSLSFYCSKDNYNRETSAAIVFEEGQEKEFEAFLNRIELPGSLIPLRKDMERLVREFSFWKIEPENPDVKKKTLFLIVLAILLSALAMIYLIDFKRN